MNQFTTIFTTNVGPKLQDKKAILFSVGVSLVFLGFSALLFRPEQPRSKRSLPVNCATPAPVALPPVETKSVPPDENAKFRNVPLNYLHFDFHNRSYGLYTSATGEKIKLRLTNGHYEYNDGYKVGGQQFDLSDVYYTDVTGDDKPEAIVLLWHFQCGVSCNGGNALIFIYTTSSDGILNEIWRYETGSYAYGCGLRSLTIMRKQITVQMFGNCVKSFTDHDGQGKYQIPDTSLINFRLSGDGFVKKESEFFSSPVRDLTVYTPEIHIIE